MLLTDALVDRLQHIHLQVLESTQRGYEQVRPDISGAPVGTGYALFAGEGSPLTQVSGFGYRTADDPSEIDLFYAGKCENWEVTVDPFTHPDSLRALREIGYRPDHFEGTLVQEIGDVSDTSGYEIVEVGEADPRWMEATWRGWTGVEEGEPEFDDLIRAVSQIPGCRRYLALVDGQPAASASHFEFEQGVYLGGAATRSPFRGRGLQGALLTRRLNDAGKGRLALMGAVPGSSSHRNAQRAGFVPIFSSMVWMRK